MLRENLKLLLDAHTVKENGRKKMPLLDSVGNYPLVSIIVVNYNGIIHLKDCLESIFTQSYPKYEVLLVDNASSDGSVAFVRKKFPLVKIIELSKNHGFARANNEGALKSRGKFIAFLNNDLKIENNWVTEMVKELLKNEQVAACGSKILTWNGEAIDYAGGIINFYGHGWQRGQGEDPSRYNNIEYTIFSCGGAMIIDREVFLKLGGFDGKYFIFFEDVDLGWRLWLAGYKVLFVPMAIAYHKSHSTMKNMERNFYFYERNGMLNVIKNYCSANLFKILPLSMLLLILRTVRSLATHRKTLFLSRAQALRDILKSFAYALHKRREAQGNRTIEDEDFIKLFVDPFRINDPMAIGGNLLVSFARKCILRLPFKTPIPHFHDLGCKCEL